VLAARVLDCIVSARDDGGPAFPLTPPAAIFDSERVDRDGAVTPAEWRANAPISGMTLRDYFAAKAVAGMLSNERPISISPHLFANEASLAYSIADAMLAERAK
jgi:hypothetical protein